MKLHFRPRAQRGFTLLELLVVLVVLGLLAGIVAPKYFAQLGRSEVKVAKAQIEGTCRDPNLADWAPVPCPNV